MPASRSSDPDGGADRVVVSADIGAPDQIAWGLSFRQLAILSATGALLWAAYSRFGPALPPVAWVAAAILAAAVAATVALGRRDGQPFDVWLRHGLALHAARSTVSTPGALASGRPLARVTPKPAAPTVLRTGATRIAADGALTVDGVTRYLVACGTTSVALRTGAEQCALLGGFGRWLNALPGATQIVVSAARHDLTPHAEAVLDAVPGLPHPALREAATDHAAFLLDLDADREPLRRQVLAVLPAAAKPEAAARTLAGLGVTARRLDGGEATAALAAAVDPYDPPVPGPRAAPGTPVTTRPQPAPALAPAAPDINPWIRGRSTP